MASTSGPSDRHDARSSDAPARPAWRLRAASESLICLLLAVTVFRAFALEGYMISTGSMAPALYGFHKRVVCPSCGRHFVVGVAFDDDPASRSGDARDSAADHGSPATCECPNCGQTDIDVRQVPRNQGDQLLVHRHAFRFRAPQRWDVAVFRNPRHATQAYVKRIAGLPGERVRIVDGDVWIDGRPARKPWDVQQAVRIPVFDQAFEPTGDPDWIPRWVPETSPAGSPQWTKTGPGFVCDPAAPPAAPSPDESTKGRSAPESSPAGEPSGSGWSWLGYRQTVRSGGRHVTTVPLDEWPDGVALPDSVFVQPVWYDDEQHALCCRGVLTSEWFGRLLNLSGRSTFRAAVQQLAADSRTAPVQDVCGYNAGESERSVSVRDLMLRLELRLSAARQAPAAPHEPDRSAELVLRMTDGGQTFDAVFDATRREVRLYERGRDEPRRTAPWPEELDAESAVVEMSLFDRQVLVAVAGRLLFEPLELPAEVAEPPSRRPIWSGCRNARVAMTSLRIFRDVHYRSDSPGTVRHAVDEPYALGPGEYFMLGDNSPVSSDSRCWPDGAVPERLFLGKPFVVHLPSRPGRMRIGDRVAYFRLPDFSRMRPIR